LGKAVIELSRLLLSPVVHQKHNGVEALKKFVSLGHKTYNIHCSSQSQRKEARKEASKISHEKAAKPNNKT
jgi:hypothetical protein